MKYIDIRESFNYHTISELQWIRLKLKWFSLIHQSGGKCMTCGEADFNCLEFHHRDPSVKDEQISYLIMGYGKDGWVRAKEEIKKCDLLCRNCHYEIHNKSSISNKKKFILELSKKDRCEECSYDKKQCLDFHHMYGKDFTLGKHDVKNINKLKEEVIKCKVVCKNCHKRIHTNKDRWGKWGSLINELSKEYDNLTLEEYISNIVRDNIETIKELYWFGDKRGNIMKYLGIEDTINYRHIFNKCIRTYNLMRKPKELKRKLNPLDNMNEDEIIRIWNNKDIKFTKEVANTLGVSLSLLQNKISRIKKVRNDILNRKEFVKQFGGEYRYKPKKRVEMTKVEIKMIELRNEGKTAKEVAELVGMTPNAVRLRYSRFIKRGIIEAIPKEFSNH